MAADASARNPYVGPRPFERTDQAFFFGRDGETADLCALIIANPVVLFYAQSGAGKSSLLNAGLRPRLEGDTTLLPTARVGDSRPQDVGVRAVRNIFSFNVLLKWSVPPAAAASLSIADYIAALPKPADDAFTTPLIAVIFDQFEELFSKFPDRWEERTPFITDIAKALEDPSVRVVFSLREDYLAEMEPFGRQLPGRLGARFRLERLQADAALFAVERPAAAAGRRFAPGVAKALVDRLLVEHTEESPGSTIRFRGRFVEPIELQVVCRDLWDRIEQRPQPGRVEEGAVQGITYDDLAQSGNVDRALTSFYENAVERAAEASGVHRHPLRMWCEEALITVARTRNIVFKGPDLTDGLPNTAVAALESARLIRVDTRAGGSWYELTHDTFIDPITGSNAAWLKQRERIIGRASLKLQNAQKELGSATQAVDDKHRSQQYKRALSLAQEAAALSAEAGDPNRREAAHSIVGSVYLSQQKYDQALVEFDAAWQLAQKGSYAAGEIFYLTRIAEVLILQGDLDRAREACSAALETASETTDVSAQRLALDAAGKMYVARGERDAAIGCFSQLIELDQREPEGYLQRGWCHFDDKQYRQAEQDYLVAHRLEPEDPIVAVSLGDVSRARGDKLLAIDWYTRALALEPDQPAVHAALASLYGERGSLDTAIDHYQSAVKLDARNQDLMTLLAYALRTKGDLDEAAKQFNNALSVDGSLVDAYMGLAGVHRRQQKYEDALGSYLRVIELDRGNVLALASLAECYDRLGRADEAARYLQMARDSGPDEYRAKAGVYNYACFVALSGDVEATIEALRMAFADGASIQEVDEDLDFEKIRHDPRFEAFVTREKAANRASQKP